MHHVKNLKIGQRLGLGFSFILLFIIGLILIGLSAMRSINKELQSIVKIENVSTQLANDMMNNAREVALAVRGTLLMKYKKRVERERPKDEGQMDRKLEELPQ